MSNKDDLVSLTIEPREMVVYYSNRPSEVERLRALLAEARDSLECAARIGRQTAPPSNIIQANLLTRIDAALAEPVGDTKPKKQTRPWEVFCRHLSVSGLPECDEPQGHKGAHVWRHIETDKLFDRAATMLREAHSERDEARAEAARQYLNAHLQTEATATAYRRGAEAMREKAAFVIDACACDLCSPSLNSTLRALPLPSDVK